MKDSIEKNAGKYPRIDGTELDAVNRIRFKNLVENISNSITFDDNENELKLTKSDIELLSWNIATNIISKPF